MGDEPSLDELTEDNAGDETLEKNVREMLEYLEEQVASGQEVGVDFTEIESMLAGARIIIESGDYASAIDLINDCMQKASKRFSDYKMLLINIKKAETEIQAAHNAGKDVTEAGRRLRMARLHMEKGDYKLGADTAKHAIEALMAVAKPVEAVWGSGLQATD